MKPPVLRPRLTPPTWDLVATHVAHGRILAGIDEVGRGCIAGPVTAAAVIMSPDMIIPGLRDSKLLTALARRRLNRQIRAVARAVGVGWVPATEVDAYGLSWAVRESGRRALAALESQPDLVILDGNHNYLQGEYESVAIVAADALIVPVAAASVVAKVARDNYMIRLHTNFSDYQFADHKGYATGAHLRALKRLGPCAAHRTTCQPVADCLA